MTLPLALALAGGVVLIMALAFEIFYIRPDNPRYQGEGRVYNLMRDRGLRRLIVDLARVSMLALLGASLQVVALLLEIAGE